MNFPSFPPTLFSFSLGGGFSIIRTESNIGGQLLFAGSSSIRGFEIGFSASGSLCSSAETSKPEKLSGSSGFKSKKSEFGASEEFFVWLRYRKNFYPGQCLMNRSADS